MKRVGFFIDNNVDGYFLPHHGILKEKSITTKLRTVFDASAVTSKGISLNDLQMKGPVIQDDLVSILLRFRQYKYVITADIEKMYRQITICPDQTKYQRILWRDTENHDVEIFELLTVTYGTKSAPFLAIRCLHELGILNKEKYAEVSNMIIHDFYVDDLLSGFDDIENAIESCKILNKILLSGCLPLRKWRSNSREILDTFEEFSVANNSESLILGEDVISKTLGLLWSSYADKLIYSIDASEKEGLTKRVMLSCISKIFDPLGIVSSTIIIAKILLQGLWQANIGWDSPIPYEIKLKWNKFINELPYLNNLEINRHVICDHAKIVELHGFSDASERAFGATIYVRSVSQSNERFCHLLIAKSKVAPIKALTIPKLELCAAHLLAKLMKKVLNSSKKTFNKQTYWTDSNIVLGWLNTPAHCLKPFVRNRVSQIQEVSSASLWKHVSSGDNPADLVSRGIYPSELKDCKVWWEGPDWLKNDELSWPKSKNINDIIIPEMRSCLSVNLKSDFPFQRFSKFYFMQRTVTYMLRFYNNSSKSQVLNVTGSLTVEELDNALNVLIKIVQINSFPREYSALLSGKGLDRTSKLLSLNPFMDTFGLIRVGGRLSNSSFQFDKKHPIVLPNNHHFTKLLFEYEHIKLLHAGPQQLLYHIRCKFWPIAARNLARMVVFNCIKCFRVKPRIIQPIMGNIPSERFNAGFPFKIVGIDYAGPFQILNRKGRGAKLIKSWICIFVCFVSKAVHLELVSELSSASFLLAFKRFISRRGKPSQIFSDNGTNFIGASRELKHLYDLARDNSFFDFNTQQGIKWNFIPVHAPHFGGLWEAGVKSVKHHLKRVAGNSNFTFEEFITLLSEIESVLNSRPLSPLSSHPSDLVPLTPGHFIIGRPLISLPEPNFTHVKEGTLNRYQKIENARQHFWNRWYKEFISELQIRTKWKENTGFLKNGDMVVVKDINMSPLNWKLGRVVNLIYGNDGVSRVAEIQTPNGIIKRDFSRICPLPITRD